MSETVRLRVLRETGVDAAAVQGRSVELLRAVQRGEHGGALRLSTPTPTIAFGRRDTRLPGYDAAVAAARELGFEPMVRSVGGRAAAFHEGTLVVDHIEPATGTVIDQRERFERFGAWFVEVLARLGVPAAVGELPGEYCAGEHSVHGWAMGDAAVDGGIHAGRVKLVGTAQRVVRGAWMLSAVLVLSGSDSLRAVTERVYAALDLPLDPSTVGAVDDLLPQATRGTASTAAGVAAVEAVWRAHGVELLDRP